MDNCGSECNTLTGVRAALGLRHPRGLGCTAPLSQPGHPRYLPGRGSWWQIPLLQQEPGRRAALCTAGASQQSCSLAIQFGMPQQPVCSSVKQRTAASRNRASVFLKQQLTWQWHYFLICGGWCVHYYWGTSEIMLSGSLHVQELLSFMKHRAKGKESFSFWSCSRPCKEK